MRVEKKSTRSTGRTPLPNAFTQDFLHCAHRRDSTPTSGPSPSGEETRRSLYAGPWEVEKVASGSGHFHAVTRHAEPLSEGGGAIGVFRTRPDALRGAATCAALSTPNHLRFNPNRSPNGGRFGHPVHDGSEHLGHLTRAEDDFLAYFHAVRCLAASPDAAALFVESLDTETLVILGRAAARRLA